MTYGWAIREEPSTAEVILLWVPSLRNTGSSAGPRWVNTMHLHRLRRLWRYQDRRRCLGLGIHKEPLRCSMLCLNTLSTGKTKWTSSLLWLQCLKYTTLHVLSSNTFGSPCQSFKTSWILFIYMKSSEISPMMLSKLCAASFPPSASKWRALSSLTIQSWTTLTDSKCSLGITPQVLVWRVSHTTPRWLVSTTCLYTTMERRSTKKSIIKILHLLSTSPRSQCPPLCSSAV